MIWLKEDSSGPNVESDILRYETLCVCVWWPNDLQTILHSRFVDVNMPNIKSSALSYLRFINLNIKRRKRQERNTNFTCVASDQENSPNRRNRKWKHFRFVCEDGRPQCGLDDYIRTSLVPQFAAQSYPQKFIFRQFFQAETFLELELKWMFKCFYHKPQKRLQTLPDIRHDILIIYFNNFISFHVFWIVFEASTSWEKKRITPETLHELYWQLEAF